MKKKVLPFSGTQLTVLMLLLFGSMPSSGRASEQVTADPNLIASGGEYHGTLQLKAGDLFTIGWFDIGGFIEMRNEHRFNQGLFPNHNWRGFVSGTLSYPVIRQMQLSLALFTGLEHESAHATMGIVEQTSDPFQMVYDHSYRKSILNALPLGAELVMYDQVRQLVLKGSGAWYFLSKNTPELSGLEVGNSGGICFSGMYRYLIGKRVGCFASVHDRFIFRGSAQGADGVYVSGDEGLFRMLRNYPIINKINTVTIQGGISLPLFQSRRRLDLYVRYLYGHIYGYVDSREVRSVISTGAVVRGW